MADIEEDLELNPEELEKRVELAMQVCNPVKGGALYARVFTEEAKRNVLMLFAQGGSIAEMEVLLGISKNTYLKWMDDEDKVEFQMTVQYGVRMAEAWFLKTGRENLNDRTFQTPLWIIQMANRYGYQTNKGSHEFVYRNTETEQVETTRSRVDVEALLTEHAASIPALPPAEVDQIFSPKQNTKKKPPIPRAKEG